MLVRVGIAPDEVEDVRLEVGSRRRQPYNRTVDLDLVFFGTSGSVPTAAARALGAAACGAAASGCCSTVARARSASCCARRVGLIELREVFVSHFHADHYLGLPGMLKTFALRGRELPLTIYGPPGPGAISSARCGAIFGKLTYDAPSWSSSSPGDVLERGDYNLVTFAVAHGVQSLGFALVEHAAAGPLRRRGRRSRSASRPGRSAGCSRRGESVTPAGRAGDHARRGARARRARAGRSSSAATRRRPRPCSERARRGGARPRGDLPRRGARAAPRRPRTRPPSRPPRSRATRRSACWR